MKLQPTRALSPLLLHAALIAALALTACVRKVTVAPLKPLQTPLSPPSHDLPQLAILAYHRVNPSISNHMTVSPELLRSHLRTLQLHGFSFITLDLWLAALQGLATLPPKPIILTFDDGWLDQYLYALPILNDYNIPAVFYVYSATIGSTNTMSWDHLRELARRGHTIGCHSATHCDLTRPFPFEDHYRYHQRLLRETALARNEFQHHLPSPINHFCYPYGYYNSNVVAYLRRAGFRSAVTVNPVANDSSTSPYHLGRFIVAPWTDPHALLDLLAARRLHVTSLPPEGDIRQNPTTLLLARLPSPQIPYASVRLKWNWRWTDAQWLPDQSALLLTFPQPLSPGIYTAQVHAWDLLSNHYIAAWLFQQSHSAPSALTTTCTLSQLVPGR
ncbi:MAG: polysaccharide deacetylase family protein [bacterium]|nr:polysaccharide deacetylase family protein [bacterium]